MLDFGRNEILGPLAFRSLWSGIAAWWCGSSASSGSVTAPTASALAGNWLIVGPMPTVPFLGTTTPPEHFRLALTIDTVGDQIVAAGFAYHFCPNFQGSYGFPSVLQGTLAQDGTVSLQPVSANSPLPDMTLTVTGKAPTVAGSAWTGNYTVNFSSLPGPVTGCVETLSDTFTATSFPLLNGTYAGTAIKTTIANGTPTTTTMTLQMALKQGGTITDATTGKTVTGNTALTGSVQVQGSPCFGSGTMASLPTGLPRSGVLGNEVIAAFTMDDGSTLEVEGSLTDASESRIASGFVVVNGGQCGSGSLPSLYQLPELDRQS